MVQITDVAKEKIRCHLQMKSDRKTDFLIAVKGHSGDLTQIVAELYHLGTAGLTKGSSPSKDATTP